MTEEQAKYETYETNDNGKEDTPKKITYHPDTTITLTELQKNFLVTLMEREEAAQTGLSHFAVALRTVRKQMFDTLRDFHPELKDYHYEYHNDVGEVKIVAKKAKRDEADI